MHQPVLPAVADANCSSLKTIFPEVNLPAGLAAEIVRMRVHPNYQGKGFGKKMLLKIEQKALTLGYKELHLETDQRLKNATQLYLKNGYVFWREEYLNGFNCFWYRKNLNHKI
jgi:GNAT superfamily N-acetyltransferase